jgi:hypothetical protein
MPSQTYQPDSRDNTHRRPVRNPRPQSGCAFLLFAGFLSFHRVGRRVSRHYDARMLSNGRLDSSRVDIEGQWININENGLEASVPGYLRDCPKRQGGKNYFACLGKIQSTKNVKECRQYRRRKIARADPLPASGLHSARLQPGEYACPGDLLDSDYIKTIPFSI